MTDIQVQWVQEMVRPDAILSAGIAFLLIGGIIFGVGSLAAPGAASARKKQIDEATQENDDKRLHRLQQEIKSVRRMPRVGKAMMFFGAIAVVAAVIMLVA